VSAPSFEIGACHQLLEEGWYGRGRGEASARPRTPRTRSRRGYHTLMAERWIGASGWNYKRWAKGVFYPERRGYASFNNDPEGWAMRNARKFRELLGEEIAARG
jgi:hypothetical protein